MYKRLAYIGLLFIGFFLAVTFITSAILSYTRKNIVKDELLLNYANKFLVEKQYAYLGKELDCSGFTKNIFRQYSIQIPASAAEQHKFCDSLIAIIKPTDLVFFKINNAAIDHVGMMVNDSVFIHSPDKGRPVRLDNLNDSYWNKHFYGFGRVLKITNNETKTN